jgi:tetratricopeptide (TPR) repeat protein
MMTCVKPFGVFLCVIMVVMLQTVSAAENPAAPAAPAAAANQEAEKAAAEKAAAEQARKAAKMAEAAKVFESLYAADLKRVKATAVPGDDIQLAQQLLAAAQQAGKQPEFLAVLCETARDLAMAGPDGYPLAVQALEQLAEAQPQRAAEFAEQLVDIRQRQFDAAKPVARPAAGEALVAAILAVIDSGKKNEAETAALYKRALGVATLVGSPQAAEIKANLKALDDAARLAREIENAKGRIAGDPSNPKWREQLVRLYLVAKDDPAEAAKCLDGVADESLRKYVPAAAKPPAEAPEPACLELGEWYRSLGESCPPGAKAAMFARAKAYYERFLSLHTAEDLDRTRAAIALERVAAVPAPAPASPKSVPTRPAKPAAPAKVEPGTFPPGQWVDLLTFVDPAQDCGQGDCSRRGPSLRFSSKSAGRVTVPVLAKGDYEAEFAFKRTWGPGQITIVLPVGSTDVGLVLSGNGGFFAGLSNINGKSARSNETKVAPSKLQNDRMYSVTVKVQTSGGQATVEATLDGGPFVKWTGPEAALSTGSDVSTRGCFGFNLFGAGYNLEKGRVKMLSGEAKLFRPAPATPLLLRPAPAAP